VDSVKALAIALSLTSIETLLVPFQDLSLLLQESLKALGTPSGTPGHAFFINFGFTSRQCV
jgi:hypothetical protein